MGRSATTPRPRVAVTTQPIGLLRARAHAPKLVLYAFIALFFVSGLVRTFTGDPAAPPSRATPAAPRDASDVTGFAQAFTRAYLTIDPERPDAHARALRPFIGGELDPDAGLSVAGDERERVTWTAVAAKATTHDGVTLVTVAAATARDPEALRYVAVPVARDGSGALVVASHPALVGPPRLATSYEPTTGDDVEDRALAGVVTRALRNYLRGAGSNLAADLDRGTRLTLPPEQLSLQSVDSLTWSGAGRVAVQVVARDAHDTAYTLRYELAVARRDRWYVRGVNDAVGSTAGRRPE